MNKYILMALGIMLTCFIIWRIKTCQPQKELLDIGYKPVTTYVDKTGKDHQVIEVQEVSPQLMKQIVDSVAKALKGKSVKYLTQVISRTDTVFQEVPVYFDTSTGDFQVIKKDAYLDLEVSGNLNTKKSQVHIQTLDTITYALTRKTRFLRSDLVQVDINNTSPYTKVVEGRSFSIREPKNLLSIGPYVGYGYNGKEFKPSVGIAITFPLINIKNK